MKTPADNPLSRIRSLMENVEEETILCMRGVVFLAESHLSHRAAIRKKIREIVERIGVERFGYFYDVNGERHELSSEYFEQLMEAWFDGPRSKLPNKTIRIGSCDWDPTPYGLQYFGVDSPDYGEDERSCLDFWVPLETPELFEDPDTDPFRDFFSGLSVTSGYIAPSILCPHQHIRQRFASRFPTLDVSDPHRDAYSIANQISGVHWCTYLNPSAYSTLGGDKLDEDFFQLGARILPSGGEGMIVRMPKLLPDKNRGEMTVAYAELAKRLDTADLLHPAPKLAYFQTEFATPDREAQIGWYGRYLKK